MAKLNKEVHLQKVRVTDAQDKRYRKAWGKARGKAEGFLSFAAWVRGALEARAQRDLR
jgi:hypothetical protein